MWKAMSTSPISALCRGNSMGNLYIVETIEEFWKESLRGYFDMITSEKRDEIIRVIHNG